MLHFDLSANYFRDKSHFVKKLISLIESDESTIQSLNISNLKLKSDINPFLGTVKRKNIYDAT